MSNDNHNYQKQSSKGFGDLQVEQDVRLMKIQQQQAVAKRGGIITNPIMIINMSWSVSLVGGDFQSVAFLGSSPPMQRPNKKSDQRPAERF